VSLSSLFGRRLPMFPDRPRPEDRGTHGCAPRLAHRPAAALG